MWDLNLFENSFGGVFIIVSIVIKVLDYYDNYGKIYFVGDLLGEGEGVDKVEVNVYWMGFLWKLIVRVGFCCRWNRKIFYFWRYVDLMCVII